MEIIEFSDLMRININMFTSLDQITPEFEINRPHNISKFEYFFKRNWRHYEGLQKHQEKGGLVIKTIDDLKISDFNKDAILNIKK